MEYSELGLKLLISILVGAAIFGGLLTAIQEMKWLKHNNRLHRTAIREMLLSLSPLPFTALVSVFMTPYWYLIYESASQMALVNIPIGIASIVSGLVLADYSYYWEHRCAHRVTLLWKLYHAPHHSSPDCTVATAYRVSFVNQFFAPAFYLPWVLIGFDPLIVLGFQLFVFHYQAWLHTELHKPFPPVDRYLNTPANHRMHHSRALQHQDVNFGAVFMIWDRMFGTYKSPEENLDYGIHKELSPKRFWQIYSYPWTNPVQSPDKNNHD